MSKNKFIKNSAKAVKSSSVAQKGETVTLRNFEKGMEQFNGKGSNQRTASSLNIYITLFWLRSLRNMFIWGFHLSVYLQNIQTKTNLDPPSHRLTTWTNGPMVEFYLICRIPLNQPNKTSLFRLNVGLMC